ncbi:hypothetical protein J2S08_002648 [Bacillus chungangensis]|uniref:Uncharacterized protein n=1 Tax=Bacillus chungangensis TaxID=587633 RepID=A0ABT9WVK2_9BACI|nr:hypothetical protein [Bacillus chungangensis]
MLKLKLALGSIILSFISIFIFPVSQINNHTYAIGFPLRLFGIEIMKVC